MIKYTIPNSWLAHNPVEIAEELASAKAAMIALTRIPFSKSWADKLQEIQLKREVAGTSRIEGAEFTEKELDAALTDKPSDQFTRSQRQARAAQETYKWIATIPDDRPIDSALVVEIHRRLVTGADDDHCPPGQLRRIDCNVSFGVPRHRGAEGGVECEMAFTGLMDAISRDFKGREPLIQALAIHYHVAAIHPFEDGNGRTARALEALVLQRAGLKHLLFIAMSNYYYEEKHGYLESLSLVRARNHDLTPFLKFGLRGITQQCERLFGEIRDQLSRALFRDVMRDLFGRLKSPRKRVIADRQVRILEILLEIDQVELESLMVKLWPYYHGLSNPEKAMIRDLIDLYHLGAVDVDKRDEAYIFWAKLSWPTEITETTFFQKVNELPKAKIGWLKVKP